LLGKFVQVMPVLVYWLLVVETVQNVAELLTVLQLLVIVGHFFDMVVKFFGCEGVSLVWGVFARTCCLRFAHFFLRSTGGKVADFRFNI